ncbi:MAG: hypothetical protein HDT40_10230 [Lachnospiraceae bacterium]|nr:hypothetical protein [Lachnospiraceae bacterium]
MNNNFDNIKKDLISLYTDIYLLSKSEVAINFFSKDVLKKLRYKPEEIVKAFEISNDAMTEKSKPKVKKEIMKIQTKEQVLAYFKEYLMPICQPDIREEDKNSILKNITLGEIKYLYKIIFDIPLPTKCKKIDAIYKIKDFFDSEERTADLTKYF